MGNKCNRKGLECIDNRCVESMENYEILSTADFFSTISTNDVIRKKKGNGYSFHITHASLFAVLLFVVFICCVNGVLCWIKQKKVKLTEESKYKHTQLHASYSAEW